MSDVRSEIHLVRCNIASTGQSVRALKKVIFRIAKHFNHSSKMFNSYTKPVILIYYFDIFFDIYFDMCFDILSATVLPLPNYFEHEGMITELSQLPP